MSKTTLIQRLCFSLFALALTAPRSCCMAASHAEAQGPLVEVTAGGAAGSGPGSALPVVISPAKREAAAEPSHAELTSAQAVNPPASESPELTRLRLLRAEEARAYQELKLVRDERLRLTREDRAEQPITGPLIVMGVGFGMSAFSTALAFLTGIGHTSDGSELSPELRGLLIGAQVVGLPLGFGGLGTVRFRINLRENRLRIEELRSEERLLQRDLNDKKRRTLDYWSVVPELSQQERRLGVSVRHAF